MSTPSPTPAARKRFVPRPYAAQRARRHRKALRQRRTAAVIIFAVDGIAQTVLPLLDTASIEAFVAFLADEGKAGRCDAAQWIFQNDALWSHLLVTHFQPPASDHMLALESAMSRREPHQLKKRAMTERLQYAGGGCTSLSCFLDWSYERAWFDQHVDVIKGDAVPTVSYLDDAFDYSILMIHRSYQHGPRPVEASYSGVIAPTTQRRHLIHVVDAQTAAHSQLGPLCRTFRDALAVIARDRELNVVVVISAAASASSSSSDDQQLSIAATGLRELQRDALQLDWNGRVGVVCYEEARFQEFKREKTALLACFGGE